MEEEEGIELVLDKYRKAGKILAEIRDEARAKVKRKVLLRKKKLRKS